MFAAASMRGALDAVLSAWEEASGHEARPAYASTAALARQIAAGAPADVFVSANRMWSDWLDERGHLVAGTVRAIAANRLVLLSATGDRVAPSDLSSALVGRRTAMGLLGAVPAGIYGEAALRTLGAWEAARPGIVEVDNVLVALALVDRGETDYAIVYATDALLSERAAVALTFPEASHASILYPAAIVSGRDGPVARDLLAFLSSDVARAIFEEHGFLPAP